jgi:hypothetical protein
MCNFRNIAHSEHCPYYQDAVKQKIKLDGFDWSELEIITEIIGCASHSFAKKGESKAMLDITGAECVEVSMRRDEKVLWVNTENGCILRICQIKNICVDGDNADMLDKLERKAERKRDKEVWEAQYSWEIEGIKKYYDGYTAALKELRNRE